jgi:hypothetical protein
MYVALAAATPATTWGLIEVSPNPSRPVWKGATGVGHVQQAGGNRLPQGVHAQSLFVWWKPLKHLPERFLLNVVGIHVCESARSNFRAQAFLGDEQIAVPRRISV